VTCEQVAWGDCWHTVSTPLTSIVSCVLDFKLLSQPAQRATAASKTASTLSGGVGAS
jgi:hypothetical protein